MKVAQARTSGTRWGALTQHQMDPDLVDQPAPMN
jgi:hypothetical protein